MALSSYCAHKFTVIPVVVGRNDLFDSILYLRCVIYGHESTT